MAPAGLRILRPRSSRFALYLMLFSLFWLLCLPRLTGTPADKASGQSGGDAGECRICAAKAWIPCGRCEGKRHVTDAEPDHRGVRLRGLEGPDPSSDLGKEVAGLELLVVLVDARHGAAG